VIEVSKEEFFKPIYDRGLDVHPCIKTDWPYTSDWEFHKQLGRPVYGRTVLREEGGRMLTSYFIDPLLLLNSSPKASSKPTHSRR
jgi:hypothetical protein